MHWHVPGSRQLMRKTPMKTSNAYLRVAHRNTTYLRFSEMHVLTFISLARAVRSAYFIAFTIRAMTFSEGWGGAKHHIPPVSLLMHLKCMTVAYPDQDHDDQANNKVI